MKLAGPSLSALASRAEQIIATPQYTGTAKTAEEYIRESILMPSAYVTPGAMFSAAGRSFMPDNFRDTLKPEQLDQLVAYLMTLR